MQKFYILDDKMNPVECSEIQHLAWIRDHGHVPILATIGFRYQIVADMRRPFDSPPEFEVRRLRAHGVSDTISRHEKFTHALLSVLDEFYEQQKTPAAAPSDKPYVAWKDDKVVPATLDETLDWIVTCPLGFDNRVTCGKWSTYIDFDADPAHAGEPFALNVEYSGNIHSRIGFKTFTDAVSAQNKFHAKLEGK